MNTKGQGGLLDIYFYKDQLFFTYAFKSKKGNTTRLAKVDYKNQKASNFKVHSTSQILKLLMMIWYDTLIKNKERVKGLKLFLDYLKIKKRTFGWAHGEMMLIGMMEKFSKAF